MKMAIKDEEGSLKHGFVDRAKIQLQPIKKYCFGETTYAQ